MIDLGDRTALDRATLVALAPALVLGALSVLLSLAAYQFRIDWFANPALVVRGGPASADLLRWGAPASRPAGIVGRWSP